MVEVYLLEQLDAFARHGTLSAVAEELCITQPALSRSMKKIEAELGVSLFDRSKAKIMLNDTGRLAAKLARHVIEEDEELVRRVKAHDRSLRCVAIGSCAPWPPMELGRLAQRHFAGRAISTEVVKDDRALLEGLRAHTYQLVVLHGEPDGQIARQLAVQRYATESMTVSFKRDHPLAGRSSIALADLEGQSILAWGNPSFWNDLLLSACPANVLFQQDIDALEELVTKTDFPTFSSDRMAESGYTEEDRIDVPISDTCAHATYYIACLDSEKERYASFLSTARSQVIGGA